MPINVLMVDDSAVMRAMILKTIRDLGKSVGDIKMTSPKSREEGDRKACELDRIAFERGLIDDVGAAESHADTYPNSVDAELEIPNEAPTAGANASILIIDDDDQFRAMLREMLMTAGFENISEAVDGREGLARYAERPTDLIITDMVMPEKLGIDIIVEIRKNCPKAKIIAISGGGSFGPEIDLDMAAKLGVHTLAKPFERQEILKAISELLPRPSREVSSGSKMQGI